MSIHKANQKWYAQIRGDDGYHYLGYYDTQEEAAKAYNKAAKKYHKEFAKLNFVNG